MGVEVKAISRSDVLLSDDVPPLTKEEAVTKEEATLLKLLHSREQAGASAEEVRAQYHAAELCRLYGHLSMQERRVILDEMIKGLSAQD